MVAPPQLSVVQFFPSLSMRIVCSCKPGVSSTFAAQAFAVSTELHRTTLSSPAIQRFFEKNFMVKMHPLFRNFFHYTIKTAEIQRCFCNFLQGILANRSKNFFFFPYNSDNYRTNLLYSPAFLCYNKLQNFALPQV